jgi:CHAD domain-containing protein
MKTTQKNRFEAGSSHLQTATLGDYAYQVIQEQYHSILKLEKKVLADRDPTHLHHMRVSTRRLRTALQVFDRVVEMPRAAREKKVGSLARTLGTLRDLDVQIEDLRSSYRPQLKQKEQSALDEAIGGLQRQRRQAFAAVEDALTRSRYRHLKETYDAWLSEPRYTPLAQLPLVPLLPDLLSPLLSELLLHPGWLVRTTDLTSETGETLHDLRKACKHARYQAEFFVPFYNSAFQDWIEEIKTIQSMLGKLHDAQVLLELLQEHLSQKETLSHIQNLICHTEADAMNDWETKRQTFLNPDYRCQLHQMLLDYSNPD